MAYILFSVLLNPYVVDRKAREIVSGMLPEDKIAQMLLLGFDSLAQLKKEIGEFPIGGIILFKKNRRYMVPETLNYLHTLSPIPLFIAIDEEGGDVAPVYQYPPLPAPAMLGEINKRDITEYAGYLTGKLVKKLGFNLVLAPLGDINVNPKNPIIGTRSFGDRYSRVVPHMVAFIQGLHSAGVMACVKHWPGHGSSSKDSHRTLPVIIPEKGELEAFKLAVLLGVDMVMVGHLEIMDFDTLPATLSPWAVKILREFAGDEVVLITDDMCMHAVRYPMHRVVRMAILAGMDVILISRYGVKVDPGELIHYLTSCYETDSRFRKNVDEAVLRIIKCKIRNGLIKVDTAYAGDFKRETLRRGVRICLRYPLDMKNTVVVVKNPYQGKILEDMGLRWITYKDKIEPGNTYILLYPSFDTWLRIKKTGVRCIPVLASPYKKYGDEWIVTFQRNYPLRLLFQVLYERVYATFFPIKYYGIQRR